MSAVPNSTSALARTNSIKSQDSVISVNSVDNTQQQQQQHNTAGGVVGVVPATSAGGFSAFGEHQHSMSEEDLNAEEMQQQGRLSRSASDLDVDNNNKSGSGSGGRSGGGSGKMDSMVSFKSVSSVDNNNQPQQQQQQQQQHQSSQNLASRGRAGSQTRRTSGGSYSRFPSRRAASFNKGKALGGGGGGGSGGGPNQKGGANHNNNGNGNYFSSDDDLLQQHQAAGGEDERFEEPAEKHEWLVSLQQCLEGVSVFSWIIRANDTASNRTKRFVLFANFASAGLLTGLPLMVTLGVEMGDAVKADGTDTTVIVAIVGLLLMFLITLLCWILGNLLSSSSSSSSPSPGSPSSSKYQQQQQQDPQELARRKKQRDQMLLASQLTTHSQAPQQEQQEQQSGVSPNVSVSAPNSRRDSLATPVNKQAGTAGTGGVQQTSPNETAVQIHKEGENNNNQMQQSNAEGGDGVNSVFVEISTISVMCLCVWVAVCWRGVSFCLFVCMLTTFLNSTIVASSVRGFVHAPVFLIGSVYLLVKTAEESLLLVSDLGAVPTSFAFAFSPGHIANQIALAFSCVLQLGFILFFSAATRARYFLSKSGGFFSSSFGGGGGRGGSNIRRSSEKEQRQAFFDHLASTTSVQVIKAFLKSDLARARSLCGLPALPPPPPENPSPPGSLSVSENTGGAGGAGGISGSGSGGSGGNQTPPPQHLSGISEKDREKLNHTALIRSLGKFTVVLETWMNFVPAWVKQSTAAVATGQQQQSAAGVGGGGGSSCMSTPGGGGGTVGLTKEQQQALEDAELAEQEEEEEMAEGWGGMMNNSSHSTLEGSDSGLIKGFSSRKALNNNNASGSGSGVGLEASASAKAPPSMASTQQFGEYDLNEDDTDNDDLASVKGDDTTSNQGSPGLSQTASGNFNASFTSPGALAAAAAGNAGGQSGKVTVAIVQFDFDPLKYVTAMRERAEKLRRKEREEQEESRHSDSASETGSNKSGTFPHVPSGNALLGGVGRTGSGMSGNVKDTTQSEVEKKIADKICEQVATTGGTLHCILANRVTVSWNTMTKMSAPEHKATRFLIHTNRIGDDEEEFPNNCLSITGAAMTGYGRSMIASHGIVVAPAVFVRWWRELETLAALARQEQVLLIDLPTKHAVFFEFAVRGFGCIDSFIARPNRDGSGAGSGNAGGGGGGGGGSGTNAPLKRGTSQQGVKTQHSASPALTRLVPMVKKAGRDQSDVTAGTGDNTPVVENLQPFPSTTTGSAAASAAAGGGGGNSSSNGFSGVNRTASNVSSTGGSGGDGSGSFSSSSATGNLLPVFSLISRRTGGNEEWLYLAQGGEEGGSDPGAVSCAAMDHAAAGNFGAAKKNIDQAIEICEREVLALDTKQLGSSLTAPSFNASFTAKSISNEADNVKFQVHSNKQSLAIFKKLSIRLEERDSVKTFPYRIYVQ